MSASRECVLGRRAGDRRRSETQLRSVTLPHVLDFHSTITHARCTRTHAHAYEHTYARTHTRTHARTHYLYIVNATSSRLRMREPRRRVASKRVRGWALLLTACRACCLRESVRNINK